MAKKKSKKRTIIIIAALAVVLVVVVGLFMSGRADEAIAVTTTKVERRTITQTVSAIGKIQPETEVKISSETSGEIVFLSVEEGDTVKKGQLLARIKPDIIETQLEQQSAAVEASRMEIETRKAEMEKAKTELSRIRELFEKEFASKKELEMAQAAYDQAVAGYKAALARLEQAQASFRQVKRSAERTTITSPMNGIITSLSVEEGENVVGTAQMAGTEMMRVSDLSVMNAVVEVDENDIVMVNLGDTSRVEIDALPENIYKGVVIEIGHSAIVSQLGTQDQVTNFQVKIRLVDNEPRLRPGMSCNVDIETETHHNVVAVPLMAVTVRSEDFDRAPDVQEGEMGVRKEESEGVARVKRTQSVVFLKKDKTAKMQKVETGISDKGFIEIKEGLEEGQTVISGTYQAVSKLLHDGAQIKVDTTGFAGKFKK